MADNYGVFKDIPIINGDIFESDADVIVHQVNCQGVMGSGVAKQVREKFPKVYQDYKEVCDEAKSSTDLLGETLCVEQDGVCVANLFAQDKFGYDGKCYTDYEALEKCLRTVNKYFAGRKVAIPYLMACHRGGGDWDIVSSLIFDTLKDCDVTFYRYVAG